MRKSNKRLAGLLLALVVVAGFWLGWQANSESGRTAETKPSRGESVPLPSGSAYPHQDVGGAEEFRQFDAQ